MSRILIPIIVLIYTLTACSKAAQESSKPAKKPETIVQKDEAVTFRNRAITIDVFNNDSNTTFKIIKQTQGKIGNTQIVSIDQREFIKYTPNQDQYGIDSFTYTVQGSAEEIVDQVVVTISPWAEPQILTNAIDPIFTQGGKGRSSLVYKKANHLFVNSYERSIGWSGESTLYSLAANEVFSAMGASMNDLGETLIVWKVHTAITESIRYSYLTGSTKFVGNGSPVESIGSQDTISIDLNNQGKAEVLWSYFSTYYDIYSVKFQSLFWSNNFVLPLNGIKIDNPFVMINKNSDVLSVWSTADAIWYAYRYSDSLRYEDEINLMIKPDVFIVTRGADNTAKLLWVDNIALNEQELKYQTITLNSNLPPDVSSPPDIIRSSASMSQLFASSNNNNSIFSWLENNAASNENSVMAYSILDGKKILHTVLTTKNEVANLKNTIDSQGNIILSWTQDNQILIERYDGTWVQDILSFGDDVISTMIGVDENDNQLLVWQYSNNDIGFTDFCKSSEKCKPSRFNHSEIQQVCSDCHLNAAQQKLTNHMLSDNQCENCHITDHWRVNDHGFAEETDNCTICHELPAIHTVTNRNCLYCHNGKIWSPLQHPDSFANINCEKCHDKKFSSGKNDTHLPSTDECAQCHQSLPLQWIPIASAAVNHNAVIGTCVSCHDNFLVKGMSPGHLSTTSICDACHAIKPLWQVDPLEVDHTQVFGRCDSCHTIPQSHTVDQIACENCHYPGNSPWLTLK